MEKEVIRGTYIVADAGNVYEKINSRLNELEKRQANQDDIEYVKEWVFKLCAIARERDYYKQKYIYAQRAFILAFSDPYVPPENKKNRNSGAVEKLS